MYFYPYSYSLTLGLFGCENIGSGNTIPIFCPELFPDYALPQHLLRASTNAAILQYSQEDKFTKPEESQRTGVFEWIYGVTLGGQCKSLGEDLTNHLLKSIFGLEITDEPRFSGTVIQENDAFFKFLLGPGLNALHRCFWRHFQVGPQNADAPEGPGAGWPWHEHSPP